ncbi:phosphatidylinositol-glycan biosynthesis class X protein isoform X2 [Numida meleagris]|uniref:phosphatidylinositol-glycan biosynthesis class X protein isoform X2 n=1 Tax=Numida meleagris TaxID=8996 RepID=UPI000B3E20A1|nr:phosphatidylinositol-glycan biosynthesis class X protein isoform X2 [Numida meleagris]
MGARSLRRGQAVLPAAPALSGGGASRGGPKMAAGRWRPSLGVLLYVQAACRGSAVSQELLKEGFHRELLVKAELGGRGQWAVGCTVAARTQLPPGVYVDPYELASLQQHNVTKAVLIPDVIDVEAPEYSATDLTVLLSLQPDPRCSRCFRAALPVHGRYHRPAGNGGDALVALKSAEILVCCCGESLSPECWQPAEVDAPCSGNKDHLCQWYSATHQPEYEELILRVPVGLTQHSFLVCVVTLLATVLCSSLILAAVCKYGDFSLVTCLE